MSERHSEYKRMPADDYSTPAWVTEALLSVERFYDPIWECAPGDGFMVRALENAGHKVTLHWPDFLGIYTPCVLPKFRSIITNPPYKLADDFIRRALACAKETSGKVAMLLPIAFDSAKSRTVFFRDCPAFKTKYTLTKRIRWANLPQTASPSMNHCWMVWDWRHSGPPTLGYLP